MHYGCRRIIQVDAAHWWWLRRFPHFYVNHFEYPEKRYINVTNDYYYKYLLFFFFPFFCYLERLYNREISLAIQYSLYCSDNLQNSKTNMTKNRDKIVNPESSKKILILYFFHIAHPYLKVFLNGCNRTYHNIRQNICDHKCIVIKC